MSEFKGQNFFIIILVLIATLYLINPLNKTTENKLAYEADQTKEQEATNKVEPKDGGRSTLASLQAQDKIRENRTSNAPSRNPQSPPKPMVLTLEELEKEFGTNLTMAKAESGIPFRLTGQIPFSKNPGESYSDAVSRLVNTISYVLNIDHPEQLSSSTRQNEPIGTTTNLQQMYENVPVDGAQLRIHQDLNGQIFMINSSYLPGVSNIIMTINVTNAEAVKIVTDDAMTLDPAGRPLGDLTPTLVIHQFKSGFIDLSWKIVVNQPWLGSTHGVGIYFVDVHRSSKTLSDPMFERIEAVLN